MTKDPAKPLDDFRVSVQSNLSEKSQVDLTQPDNLPKAVDDEAASPGELVNAANASLSMAESTVSDEPSEFNNDLKSFPPATINEPAKTPSIEASEPVAPGLKAFKEDPREAKDASQSPATINESAKIQSFEATEPVDPGFKAFKEEPREAKDASQSLDQSPNRASVIKAWIQASRAPFFIATVFPLVLGFIAAYKHTGEAKIGLFFLILLASFLVHLATNLANDYFDFSLGVDTKETIGGSRVIQEGLIEPGQIKLAIGLCYTVAFLLAIVIVGKNVSLWVIVVLAALSSFFYVAPPIKYGHRALGELSVFINMGLFMTIGTQAALTNSFLRTTIALALPISFMVAGILYYQSIPEIETDPAAGKITLAVILGKEGSFLVYLLWWPLIWLLLLTLYLAKLVEWPALLGLLSLPLHVAACRRFKMVQNWLELDRYGHLIRKLYVVNALALILGLAFR
ncbi:MAG: prenyltransferase [Deltaproteobacteria bacterium]|jgi:1,4-dihydroxy-2-naphthoate octaprenyltransferase|nr:prenyltransferase [Deltaproteobacteria bacterium]